jgi:hypothetical protein
MRWSFPSRFFTLAAALIVVSLPAWGVEFGPQGIVRQFCQADALGERVTVGGWVGVAPLLEWSLEPAWDHVMLIAGYSVDPPHRTEGGVFTVDVSYSVVGVLSASGLTSEPHLDRITFQVRAPDERGWRIMGPPPPPYIFSDLVDVDTMRRSFADGNASFMSNTAFVWQMFRAAGWNVSPAHTADLLSSGVYRTVDQPAVGDLVAYLRDDSPYHVGILEAHEQVVSSTLNAGIVRASLNAFAGEVKYLRLVSHEPEPQPLRPQLVIAEGSRTAQRRRLAQSKGTPQRTPAEKRTPRPPRGSRRLQ